MVDSKFDEYGNKIVNEAGTVSFTCPACKDAEVSRSRQARAQGKKYTCPKCGVSGPLA